ncbi:LamG-like jellyroll fold domain-containing protein [Deminuibacter soli]|nr:LamG-like jellyroll fold domain-containing protein [Deminuibacter soli]
MQSWLYTDHNPMGSGFTNLKLSVGRTGRYLRLQLPFTENLNLAELQVFSGGNNIAPGKSTSQSSTASSTTTSDRAVDGNTDGVLANGSIAQTVTGNAEMEPWWQIDLGSSVQIDSVVIWNRTDCCVLQMHGFYLFVSDNAFTGSTLATLLTQPGVSNYIEPTTGGGSPSLTELQNSQITAPSYYEPPYYNYTLNQADPGLYWSLARTYGHSQYSGTLRGPSAFEQSNGVLNSLQTANVDKCYSVCIGDEDANGSTNVTYWKNWFNIFHSKYPDVLVHSNQYINQWSESQLRSYMQTAHPDIMTYDFYNFYINRSPGPGTSYGVILGDMVTYRKLALEGWDGTGKSPILFGAYLQGYQGTWNGVRYSYIPSESEFNVGMYSYLLMGAKWLNIFRYIREDMNTFFWTSNGVPTPQYWQYASLGKELKQLSPHLSRLQTTDVRFIPGLHTSGDTAAANAMPAGIAAFDASADPYVKAVTAVNLVAGTNNGLRGDVALGYFRPVDGINNTPGITMSPVPAVDTRYFMLMNGLVKSNGCCHALGTSGLTTDTTAGKANQAIQKITLSIDFGANSPDTLYRVRRSDGVVEMVSLVHDSATHYHMTDTLEGGKADLFYWKHAATAAATGTTNAVKVNAGIIDGGNVTELNGTQKFTMEAWVKFNTIGAWNSIVSKNATNTARTTMTVNADGKVYLIVANGNGSSYGYTAAGVITTGKWYHVAGVFDGSQSANGDKVKIYVNGVSQSLTFAATMPSTAANTAVDFVAGSSTVAASGTYVDGMIDEVRVWKDALPAGTIAGWKDRQLGNCHPNISSLVVYWPLDDITQSSKAQAGLGTAYTGTITNGYYLASSQASDISSCTGAGAVRVNNGIIDGGNVTQLNGASKFTMEAWVNLNTIGAWNSIVSKNATNTTRTTLTVNTDGRVYMIVANGNGSSYGYTAAGAVTTGQWYHLAAVFDGTQSSNAGKLKIFINGISQPLTFAATMPTSSATTTVDFVAGSSTVANSSTYLDGTVDEVRVWSQALADSTIMSWKDKVLGNCHPNVSNLVLYWPLDNGSIDTVATAGLSTSYIGRLMSASYVNGIQLSGTAGCAEARVMNTVATSKLVTAKDSAEQSISLLTVFPNPVHQQEKLVIQLSSKTSTVARITLYDMSGKALVGRTVSLAAGNNRAQLTIPTVSTGIYLVRVDTQTGIQTFKIIIQ